MYWLETSLCQNCIWNSHKFSYSVCRLFTKHCEKIQKFTGTGNLKHLYRNEFDKSCFDHDAAYSDSKDLAKATISEMILKDRAFEIAKNCKYDGYQTALASIVCKFFDKKIWSGVNVNEHLAEDLHKPVI